jgi:hypothetical protein
MKGCYDIRGNWVTVERRLEVQALINKAIAAGEMPSAMVTPCERCGQDKGIRHTHTDDYDNWQDTIEYLCWRCHMMHHSRHRCPEAVARYEAEVKAGKVFPPVFNHNFKILKAEHGVK